MLPQALTNRFAGLVLLLAPFVAWEAQASCPTPSATNRLLAETTKELGLKRARRKKPKPVSWQTLAASVYTRGRESESRETSKVWIDLAGDLQPLVNNTSPCELTKETQVRLAAILTGLLARPNPPIFDIIAVRCLFRQLVLGENAMWSS